MIVVDEVEKVIHCLSPVGSVKSLLALRTPEQLSGPLALHLRGREAHVSPDFRLAHGLVDERRREGLGDVRTVHEGDVPVVAARGVCGVCGVCV